VRPAFASVVFFCIDIPEHGVGGAAVRAVSYVGTVVEVYDAVSDLAEFDSRVASELNRVMLSM
jgi:hypothetical protein